jgi:hypothetical protein
MKDMTPLFETSHSERTRALLRAGRADRPPAGFSERLLVGLGVGVAVSGVSMTAAAGTVSAAASGAASTGSGAAGLALATAKWVAVGVLGGGILAGGADLALSPKRVAPVSSSAVQQRQEPKSPSATTLAPPASGSAQPPSAPDAELEASEARAVTSGVAESAERGRLAREVQAIDRARRALAAGNAGRALLELDALERGAMSGVLDREAWILRIEALHMSGQKGRARQLAVRYRETFPNDAHAARLRAVEEE